MLEILRGSDADEALQSPVFQANWDKLKRACPWSTVFQGAPFVTVWYGCYAEQYEPIVVREVAPDGTLEGLLFLARDRVSGTLVPCGASQAEYSTWLARPDRVTAFAEGAWSALARLFPQGRIVFLFLAPNTPVTFSAPWRHRCFLRPFARPLLDTTPESDVVHTSLKKKGNKSKLNHLQRLGAFEFKRVENVAEFDRFLDEMIPFFEARQLALAGTAPFREDPHRRGFLRELFRRNLLHVTATTVDGRLAAGHVGQINGDQVVLGMIAHSPFLAKYSAGKLHMLLLAAELQKERFSAFDLTPGGEYKERFATHRDEAHALVVCLSVRQARLHSLQRHLIEVGKRFVSAETAKALVAKVRHKLKLVRWSRLPLALLRTAGRAMASRVEYRVYALEAAAAAAARPVPEFLNRDRLSDLLLYEPAESSQPPRQAFFQAALERLGEGQRFYSRVEGGRLVHWGWVNEHEAVSTPTETGRPIVLPVRSAVLFDFYTDRACRRRGYYRQALEQCIAEAGRIPGVRHVAIGVVASNLASRRPIEAAGFEHWRSEFRTRVLWHRRQRQRIVARRFPVPETPPPDARRKTAILVMAQWLHLGGSERQLSEMARALNGAGFTVHVGCLRSGGIRTKEIQNAGIPVMVFPLRSFRSVRGLGRCVMALRRYVRDHHIDLVHAFDAPTTILLGAARRWLRPSVVLTSQRYHLDLVKGLGTRTAIRASHRVADGIVVNSEALRRHLLADDGLREESIYLCHNGIDTRRFRRIARKPDGAVPAGAIVVGTACSMRSEKDLPTLLQAFAERAGKDPRLFLVLVGDGPERERLEMLAGQLHVAARCQFVPGVDDVVPWMSLMDVFVLSSRTEGLPNGLMEAMACGCACVATRVGGVPELVEDGHTGLLFEAGDASRLATLVGRLADDPELRARLGRSAARRIAEAFSIEAAVSRLGGIYQSHLAAKRAIEARQLAVRDGPTSVETGAPTRHPGV